MPKPVFIVCSESGAIDRVTGLLSVFNVFDTLQVSVRPAPPELAGITPMLTIRTIATWMREDTDPPEQEYDHQLLIHIPGVAQEQVMMESRFGFSKRFHRFEGVMHGRPFPTPGLLRIESRIRRVGDQGEWLSQSYPIFIEVTDQEQGDGQPTQGTNPTAG